MNPCGNSFNNSSGFIYFNTSNLCQAPTTPDFLAFNDPYNSPKNTGFSPVHYSSPQKFQNFHARPPGRNSFRYHNSPNNSFNNSNRSYGSPNFNKSRTSNGYQHMKGNSSFQSNGKRDMSIYLDRTCLEDPWAELERTQAAEQKSESQTKTNSSEPQGNRI